MALKERVDEECGVEPLACANGDSSSSGPTSLSEGPAMGESFEWRGDGCPGGEMDGDEATFG